MAPVGSVTTLQGRVVHGSGAVSDPGQVSGSSSPVCHGANGHGGEHRGTERDRLTAFRHFYLAAKKIREGGAPEGIAGEGADGAYARDAGGACREFFQHVTSAEGDTLNDRTEQLVTAVVQGQASERSAQIGLIQRSTFPCEVGQEDRAVVVHGGVLRRIDERGNVGPGCQQIPGPLQSLSGGLC